MKNNLTQLMFIGAGIFIMIAYVLDADLTVDFLKQLAIEFEK